MVTEKELYIVLTDTGTLFTRLIKQVTGAPLNHASLALDPRLNEVYSFGRKNVRNPFFGGFVRENIRHPFFRQAECAIYKCTVSTDAYLRIARRINEMRRSPERYKYHLLGLFGVLFDKPIESKDAYFCSQFVASVFEQAGFPLVGKPACLVTPEDLSKSPYLQLVYRGNMHDFSEQHAG
ncbi:hypothetical protein ACFQWB_12535 [Paenibacillus thermoaerophilus]|uniref:Permuted papain-like amidase enzyme, YaeF/YiiX, C92 family n=1 Tax=Paenibacillus thermoaerophilus TaxID=1215385 RepID=A0ABW2V682_9BACL|nr:hypothetical protein [Paenibacillus thermoaerophilus]TMV17179.1 hypothetical protein FE781_08380 [Paenibacillus thermoaerophilus]